MSAAQPGSERDHAEPHRSERHFRADAQRNRERILEAANALLQARGVECELLIYDDEGHGLAKRVNRLDAYPRMFDFLRRHLSA